MRQIVLDTETTGLEPSQGHRIIEIGCVEMVNRRVTGRTFHQYLNPDRAIDSGAVEVHGITNQFLADKPHFPDIAGAFVEFVDGAELIIHNAPFDVGFIDHELGLLGESWGRLRERCPIVDTLGLAREKHPGQKNSLDALCKRYEVDNSGRDLHGALLDAQILADVYLAMTGGQATLSLGGEEAARQGAKSVIRRLDPNRSPLAIRRATSEELAAHADCLEAIESASNGQCVWKRLDG